MDFRFIIFRVTAWSTLAGIGRVRVFRSSYYLFFLIPIAARFLHAIDPNIEIHILGDVFRITLDLPFNWKLLYFSSLFFVISISLYWLFCPHLIKDFRDFREFQEGGHSQEAIKADLATHLHDGKEEGKLLALGFSERYCDRTIENPINFTEVDIGKDKLAEAFWFARRILDSRHPIKRWICFYSYVLAFLLLAIILVQNFLYVWNFTFRSA